MQFSEEEKTFLERVQKDLQDSKTRQYILTWAFKYDSLIKEEVNDYYHLIRSAIEPVSILKDQSVALVKFHIVRNRIAKFYSFLFVYTADKLDIVFAHPGETIQSVAMFRETNKALLLDLDTHYKGKLFLLKETMVSVPLYEEGWQEIWTWIDKQGFIAKTQIEFRSAKTLYGFEFLITQLPLET